MNTISIVRTTFVNKDGDKSYGYRIYDNYDHDYYNMLKEIDLELSAEDFLQIIENTLSERAKEMIDFAKRTGESLDVDSERFVWTCGAWHPASLI